MKHYNIFYNIALDYISKYKKYNYFHNKYHSKKDNHFDKTKPSFQWFPWDYRCDDKWFISKNSFMKLVN